MPSRPLTRLAQVANAIRFTATSPLREITVAVELLEISGIEDSDVALRLDEGYLASGAMPVNLCISVVRRVLGQAEGSS